MPKRADGEHRRRRARGAPHQRAQARCELVEVDRLDHIAVGAAVEAAHAVADGVAGGQDQHRQRTAGGTQPAQQLESGQARQPQVEHHGRVGLGLQRQRRRLAVAHPVDVEAALP